MSEMNYEDINGPMYCDFESLQKGIELDQEGDEWFGELIDLLNRKCLFKINIITLCRL